MAEENKSNDKVPVDPVEESNESLDTLRESQATSDFEQARTMAEENKSNDKVPVDPVEESDESLDTLRESQATSDFEKLVVANLPGGDVRRWVRTKKYTVPTSKEAKEIDKLKNDIKSNVPDGPNVKWDDERRYEKQLQSGTAFDFDMYLRVKETEGPVRNEADVGTLLGTAGQHIHLIAGKKATDVEYRGTMITDKTWLWVEICTDPFKARHKLYQLLRACLVLNRSNATTIMCVICLNGDSDTAKVVADFLRQNNWIREQALKYNMELAIAWTQHRNLYASILSLERKMDDGLAAVKKDMDDGLAAVKKDMDDGLAAVKKDMDDGLAAVKKDMDDGLAAVKKDMDDGLAAVKKDMHDGLAAVKKDMHDDLAAVKNDVADVKNGMDKLLRQLSPQPPELQPVQPLASQPELEVGRQRNMGEGSDTTDDQTMKGQLDKPETENVNRPRFLVVASLGVAAVGVSGLFLSRPWKKP